VVWRYLWNVYCAQSSGLYEYKTVGVLADVEPEICAQVFVDAEYRKKWDKYMLGKKQKYK